jgi:hypothetical protein
VRGILLCLIERDDDHWMMASVCRMNASLSSVQLQYMKRRGVVRGGEAISFLSCTKQWINQARETTSHFFLTFVRFFFHFVNVIRAHHGRRNVRRVKSCSIRKPIQVSGAPF